MSEPITQAEHDDTGFGGGFVPYRDDDLPALQGIDALVTQVEEGVRIIQKLTDRLLAAEKRLAELEDHVGRKVFGQDGFDRNPY